jgi:hypothetical protein
MKKGRKLARNKKFIFFMLLILWLGNTGCQQEIPFPVTEPPILVTTTPTLAKDSLTEVAAEIPESPPSVTWTPTATPLPTHSPTPTRHIMPTDTPIPDELAPAESCDELTKELNDITASIAAGIVTSGDRDNRGVWVESETLDQPILLDAATLALWTVKVSPNGHWLVRTQGVEFDTEGNRLVLDGFVFNPATNELFQTRIENELVPKLTLSGFDWLNDSQLVTFTIPETNDSSMTYILWSPFENEVEIFSVEMPGYEHIIFGGTIYPELDPLLEYIAYPCYNPLVCGDKDFRILSLTSGNEAWFTESSISPYAFPRHVRWSPDGQFLATSNHEQVEPDFNDLIIYDRQGEQVDEISLPDIGYDNGQWSPDGNYIAFRRSRESGQSEGRRVNLAYVDLNNRKVVDLCVTSPQRFYWSPDSTRLAVEYINIPDESPDDWLYEIAVIDIVSGEVYKVTERTSPGFLLGWVVPGY